ncbi:MAG: amino acid permease [Spartobacteria bacterium]|nr:amino acid permease [Spartobacteria bacterium]
MPTKGAKKVLGVFSVAMINLAIIYSVRGLPMLAEEGLSAIFYLLVSAAFFLIPVALVSAELATTWPPRGPGGVYVWVREAMGEKWGFVAVWLQWSENVIWFPTVLSFIAATLAYTVKPALANNAYYMLAVILIVYWGGTWSNLRGMKTAAWVSTIGVLSTLVTTGLIIVLGGVWMLRGDPLQITLSLRDMIPDLSGLDKIVFLAGVMVITSGIEVSAVHHAEVRDPARVFPRATLLAVIISFSAILLGSLAIAIVIPAREISLVAGLMEAFECFFKAYHISWLVPVVAALVVVGSIGEVSAWILGPSKGLLVTARDGLLPPFFQRTNKNGVPVNILLIQAYIVSALVLVFLLMPSVNSAYWILTALTAQLYLVMYILLFAAVIRLRYLYPDTPRPYRIPGGLPGIWCIGGLGIVGSLFTLLIGFVPPSQLSTGNIVFYEAFLLAGILIMVAVPFILYRFKKTSWISTGLSQTHSPKEDDHGND